MLPLLEKILKVKKPVSGLPDSLLAQYRALAESMGFRSEPIEKGLLLKGKTVTLALKIEFGNRWEFFNTITAMRETDADIKLLVTSSNSKSMPMETVYTVLKKKLGEKLRWAIVDIEGKKEPMFLNFSASDIGRAPPQKGGSPQASRPPSARSNPSFHFPSSSSRPAPLPGAKSVPSGRRNSIRRARTSKGKSAEPEMRKTKNYGMQPANAPRRRKRIYGKRRKRQD